MDPQPLDLEAYRAVVVLTGAGVSVASGLRPYRGPGGLWEDEATRRYSSAAVFAEDPDDAWRHWGTMREAVRRAEPNPAHVALADAQRRVESWGDFTLVTQNVDGLHQRAGSRAVVELHGSLLRTRCSREGCDLELFEDAEPHAGGAPACPHCGAPLRPDIVQFEEPIPGEAEWRAKRALRDCDLFLAIGTSGTVSPASGFVRSAVYAGARTVLVNLEAMDPPNDAFHEEVLGPAEVLLPVLLGGDG